MRLFRNLFRMNQPPLGLLEVCLALGRDDYYRCLVFNSPSKRSNLAGMRSGFVAGSLRQLNISFVTEPIVQQC